MPPGETRKRMEEVSGYSPKVKMSFAMRIFVNERMVSGETTNSTRILAFNSHGTQT